MDNTREKLIDVLSMAHDAYYSKFDASKTYLDVMADHLIANGVTFATDNNVGDKWIPVSERLPEEGDSVLALCWHHEAWIPFVCHLSVNFKGRWITNMAGQWMVHVSHWMPLPEPPKGE